MKSPPNENLQIWEFFLRQPPPRQIPPQIWKDANRSLQWTGLLGVVLLGLGSILVSTFFPTRLLDEYRLRMTTAQTTGEVIRVSQLAVSENNVHVYQYDFAYYPRDGTRRFGTAYSTGRRFDEGTSVIVEYLPEQPTIARIRGCRLSRFSSGAAGVVIMPLTGIGFLWFWQRMREKNRNLLTHGVFALGEIESVEATGTRINNQRVYRVNVTFAPKGGPVTHTSYNVVGEKAADAMNQKRAAQEKVGLLYDPIRPRRVLIVDAVLRLPGR